MSAALFAGEDVVRACVTHGGEADIDAVFGPRVTRLARALSAEVVTNAGTATRR